jgi:hypothetical protein
MRVEDERKGEIERQRRQSRGKGNQEGETHLIFTLFLGNGDAFLSFFKFFGLGIGRCQNATPQQRLEVREVGGCGREN